MSFPSSSSNISFGFGPHLSMESGAKPHFKDDDDDERKEMRKKSFKGTEMSTHQRRGEHTISLRKDRREETMAKRRAACQPQVPTTVSSSVPDAKLSPEEQLKRYAHMLHNVPATLNPSQQSMLLDVLIHMREWSRVIKFPMADKLIEAKLVVPLIRIYHSTALPGPMSTEAAQILNNLSCVSAKAVIEMFGLGILDLIYPCIVKARSNDHFQNSVWLLANICGRHPDYRDKIQIAAVPIIMQLTKNEANIRAMPVPALRQISFLIRNICRVWEKERDQAEIVAMGFPPFGPVSYRQCNYDLTKNLCPILWLLANHTECQVILNSVEAFRHLLFDVTLMPDGKTAANIQIQEILTKFPELIKLLVNRITHEEPAISVEVLYCLAHIASGNDNHTQAVIDSGALAATLQVLTPPFKKIHKHSREVSIRAYFLLSNITGGTVLQCSSFINSTTRDKDGKDWTAVSILMHDISTGLMTVATEACHVLEHLVNKDCIKDLRPEEPEYVERMKHYFQVMNAKGDGKETSSVVSAIMAKLTNIHSVSVDFLDLGLKIIQNLLYLGQYRSPRPNAVPVYVPPSDTTLQDNKMFYDMENTNGFEVIALLRSEHPNPAIFKRADDILRVFNDKFLQDEFDGPDDMDPPEDADEVETFTRTVLPSMDSKDASSFWSAPLPPPPNRLAGPPDMKYGGQGYNLANSSSAAAGPNPYAYPGAYVMPPSNQMIAPHPHSYGGLLPSAPTLPPPPMSRHPTCGDSGVMAEMND